MTITTMIKKRLDELGLEQRDLARAAQVTESYISQLLNRRRALPAPDRTDIYERLDDILSLPQGQLASMVALQRQEELLRAVGEESLALYPEIREHTLGKCRPIRRRAVEAVFEKQPFGELERMVIQTLLDLFKRLVRGAPEEEDRLRTEPKTSAAESRTRPVRELLDADILDLPQKAFIDYMDGYIAWWDFDLTDFEMQVLLRDGPNGGDPVRFRFAEIPRADKEIEEPGFLQFLGKPGLSGTANKKEIAFLRSLRFKTGRPTALYYYHGLQNIRDPLHIVPSPAVN